MTLDLCYVLCLDAVQHVACGNFYEFTNLVVSRVGFFALDVFDFT